MPLFKSIGNAIGKPFSRRAENENADDLSYAEGVDSAAPDMPPEGEGASTTPDGLAVPEAMFGGPIIGTMIGDAIGDGANGADDEASEEDDSPTLVKLAESESPVPEAVGPAPGFDLAPDDDGSGDEDDIPDD